MANPFDQFDAPAANSFDQFDSQPQQYGNNDVLADGTRVPVGSPQAIAARSPVAGNSFLRNALLGVGKLDTDVGLGVQQMYASATGGNVAGLQAQAAQKRAVDAPLQATGGAKVGEIAGALPLGFVPGANTYAGAAVIGGAMGATQPTVQGESRLMNTGIGATTGVVAKFGGDKFTGWLRDRALQPFMGWTPSTANRVAANAVGVDSLDQSGLSQANQQLGAVFRAARSPDVTAPLGADTAQAVTQAAAKLNPSTAQAFTGNAAVNDLMTHLRSGTATAEQLGSISSDLGAEAAQQMKGMGDRALGKALFAVKSHVDDLVGSTITDPALAQAYQKALPQWRLLTTLESRPTLLNSTTGEVNMTALGKYLQRTDKAGYARGGNQSELYNAARWGQATGEGKGAPPLTLGNFGIPWAKYQALNNPLSRAIGGSVSRLGAPVAPALQGGIQGLAFGSTPVLLPYLEE